ncbi:MAG: DNA repair protein RadC [Pirellulaceae bacterium]
MSDETFDTESIPSQDATAKRYDRYLPVIRTIRSMPEFQLVSIKKACDHEKPGFVTRVINELVQQGWLIRETAASSGEVYHWNNQRGDFSVTAWLDEKLFGTQLKSTPQGDRPRERLLSHGAENLRTAELLAILIRSGRPGESAVAGGEKLAKAFDGKLQRLATAGRGELKAISPSIEKTAYCQIMAGIELGRRVAALSEPETASKICSPEDAAAFCRRRFARLVNDSQHEEFHIVTLDTKNKVIDTHCITVGTLDASLVHPREVFRAAIKDAAQSIILVHNHPSGDPTPSREDHAVTERLESAGKLIGIQVLDHIVLGTQGHASIRQSR